MTISPCPKCGDEITVPSCDNRAARVQCPLCQEEYLLDDVLKGLPKTLILLDAPAGGYQMAGENRPPAFEFEEASAPQSDLVPAYIPVVTPSPRPKPKPLNVPVMMMKYASIIICAITLAQFILMWLPGQYSRDPFKIGPSVGYYVPWIVPSHLRPIPEVKIDPVVKTEKPVKPKDEKPEPGNNTDTTKKPAAKPGDIPTKPDGKPTQPSDKPTKPGDKLSKPDDKPTEPDDKKTKPDGDPAKKNNPNISDKELKKMLKKEISNRVEKQEVDDAKKRIEESNKKPSIEKK